MNHCEYIISTTQGTHHCRLAEGDVLNAERAAIKKCIEIILTHNLPHGRDNSLLNNIADRVRALLAELGE